MLCIHIILSYKFHRSAILSQKEDKRELSQICKRFAELFHVRHYTLDVLHLSLF